MSAAIGILVVLAAATILARIWRRRGWGDAAQGDDAGRKLQRSAVPAVGGLALLIGWTAQLGYQAIWNSRGALAAWTELAASLPGYPPDLAAERGALAVAASLVTALVVGWVDDARAAGLSPLAKLAGQALAGAWLALPLWWPGGEVQAVATQTAWAWSAAYVVAAWVACNALNTFDNADGAAAGVTGVGLLAASSWMAPAVLALSALQVLGGGRGLGGARQPGGACVYLGDAGSHLLGIAALVVPGAWPLLWLPLLDLLRVALARLAAGQPPWRGDRRHLAHRLQRKRYSALTTLIWLLALAAPAMTWPGPLGLGLSAALFVLAVRHTSDVADESNSARVAA